MKGLIYLNLHAEAYYSGAEYDETVFITPEDYRKYFCKDGLDTREEIEIAKDKWHEKESSVGELDGKHSNVLGDVYVDFFDEQDIKEQYEKPNNDGNFLINELLHSVCVVGWEESRRIIKEINDNVDKMVKEIGVYVEVKYRIPEDKVDELNTYVENLLTREQRAKEYEEDLEEFINTRCNDEHKNRLPRKYSAERFESFMQEFNKFREQKRGGNKQDES